MEFKRFQIFVIFRQKCTFLKSPPPTKLLSFPFQVLCWKPILNVLGSLPVLSANSFTSYWQLPFLNQRKGENGLRNFLQSFCLLVLLKNFKSPWSAWRIFLCILYIFYKSPEMKGKSPWCLSLNSVSSHVRMYANIHLRSQVITHQHLPLQCLYLVDTFLQIICSTKEGILMTLTFVLAGPTPSAELFLSFIF